MYLKKSLCWRLGNQFQFITFSRKNSTFFIKNIYNLVNPPCWLVGDQFQIGYHKNHVFSWIFNLPGNSTIWNESVGIPFCTKMISWNWLGTHSKKARFLGGSLFFFHLTCHVNMTKFSTTWRYYVNQPIFKANNIVLLLFVVVTTSS